MGRKSNKENKSYYQLIREEQNLTREKASELMPGISAERIEKIENGKVNILPEDIRIMAEAYHMPSMNNYYCTHECEIGKGTVEELEHKELVQIAVETLNGLNRLDKERDRLLEIVEDGEITSDEYDDFVKIKKTLDKIAVSVASLKLWIDEKIADGKLDAEIFKEEK